MCVYVERGRKKERALGWLWTNMKKIQNIVDKANVIAQPSRIPNGGTGLFATVQIPKGGQICTYAGRLYDAREAMYRDPTYMVNFELGKGFKLDGDGADGDIGHFANATQVNEEGESFPPVNARFCMKSKRQWLVSDDQTGEIYFRGRFELVARRTIEAGEEIILDYGKGYWQTMTNYWKNGPPPRSNFAIARDMRAKRRLERFRLDLKTSATATGSDKSNLTNIATNRRKRAREDNLQSHKDVKKIKKADIAADSLVKKLNDSIKEVKVTRETRSANRAVISKHKPSINDTTQRRVPRSTEDIPKSHFQLKRRKSAQGCKASEMTSSSTRLDSTVGPDSQALDTADIAPIEFKVTRDAKKVKIPAVNSRRTKPSLENDQPMNAPQIMAGQRKSARLSSRIKKVY